MFSFVFVAAAFALPPVARADSNLLKRHSSRPLQAESDPAAFEAWETPISGFFVRSHFDVPTAFDPDDWTIVVDGLVNKPLKMTVRQLRQAAQSSFHAVLECSGNGRALQEPGVPGVQWRTGAVGNAGWSGVRLKDLLAKAGVKTEAKFVTFTGADQPAKADVPGFIRSIPLAKALDDQTLLATSMNGAALPLLHGGPVRVVLPGWYGENWVKWTTHVTLTAAEDQGFYMKKAYRMPKTPVKPGEAWDSATGVAVETLLVQSFVDSPRAGATVAPHGLNISGKAYSGSGAIGAVSLSLDGGVTWSPAKLEPQHADGGWQEFSFAAPDLKVGALTIMTRATDATGNEQPLEHTWNPSGYLRQAVERLDVNVDAEAQPSGATVLADKCTLCHSRQLIESQRLTPGQWEKTVDKMVKVFKVELSPGETKALLAYVAKYSPELTKVAPEPVVYASEARRFETSRAGDPKHGAKLFAAHCADCHGKEAQGDKGPRLKGRTVPDADFRGAVAVGRGLMPPFAGQLAAKDLDDLQAFLR